MLFRSGIIPRNRRCTENAPRKARRPKQTPQKPIGHTPYRIRAEHMPDSAGGYARPNLPGRAPINFHENAAALRAFRRNGRPLPNFPAQAAIPTRSFRGSAHTRRFRHPLPPSVRRQRTPRCESEVRRQKRDAFPTLRRGASACAPRNATGLYRNRRAAPGQHGGHASSIGPEKRP